MNTSDSTDVIERLTIPALAVAWEKSRDELTQAMQMIATAQERLLLAFGEGHYGFTVMDRHNMPDPKKPQELMMRLRKDAWRCLVDRLGLRQYLSVKSSEQLDKMLERGELEPGVPLPDITIGSMTQQLRAMIGSIPDEVRAAKEEVFKMLRPYTGHVTNHEWRIGPKVIMTYMVGRGYGGRWGVNYGRARDQLRALDNVFHSMDGKGMSKEWGGPLAQAIGEVKHSDEPRAETEYFRVKMYKNGNLHIEFKRMDLVDQLNAAGGNSRELPGVDRNQH